VLAKKGSIRGKVFGREKYDNRRYRKRLDEENEENFTRG